MHKYPTGENIELLDQVKVGMFGMEFFGEIVYIQYVTIPDGNYKWCEEKNLKGVVVEWSDADFVKNYLGLTDEFRETIADYIQLLDWDSEDLIFLNRKT